MSSFFVQIYAAIESSINAFMRLRFSASLVLGSLFLSGLLFNFYLVVEDAGVL